jgi:hypothetical protein
MNKAAGVMADVARVFLRTGDKNGGITVPVSNTCGDVEGQFEEACRLLRALSIASRGKSAGPSDVEK